MSESEGKPIVRRLRENEKAPEFPGLSVPCQLVQEMPDGGGGNRIFGNSPEKIGDAIEDDALSDARRLDSRLAALIRAWPQLPEDVKGRIAEVLILTDAA